jgi:hypothetical protein
MKQTIIIASLLAAVFVGLAPTATAADCSSLNPGSPGGGVEGQTVWYAKADAYASCTLANAVQASALQNAGAIAGKLGSVGAGATTLVNAGALASAATAYAGSATLVGTAQAYDACSAIIGPSPQCGSNAGPSQAQSCAAGVAVPNPVGGGLAGGTLANANGALQATCAVANGLAAGLPSQAQLTAFVGATQATLLGLNGDVFAIASNTLDGACIALTGATGCI